MKKPLLVRMASVQTQQQSPPPSRYDSERDELLVFEDGEWTPAIDANGSSPVTKKKDIEKGEDAKDRW